MIVGKGNAETEAGVLPDPEYVEAMIEYSESLAKAGVLLAAEGLYPSSRGARVAYRGGRPTVLDGPFTESKELIAGFWIIQVRSREEAVEWALRLPVPPGCPDGVGLELWQVFDVADMPQETLPPETAAREQALRESLERGTGA
ncbi:YciI family protein [Nonomuraea sp. NPDC050691]|uniref:YciI family protein n=1 Tax=Nonomuraea sp. NPDC050691 TaxID=3155661 RepID=UPI0033CEC562